MIEGRVRGESRRVGRGGEREMYFCRKPSARAWRLGASKKLPWIGGSWVTGWLSTPCFIFLVSKNPKSGNLLTTSLKKMLEREDMRKVKNRERYIQFIADFIESRAHGVVGQN